MPLLSLRVVRAIRSLAYGFLALVLVLPAVGAAQAPAKHALVRNLPGVLDTLRSSYARSQAHAVALSPDGEWMLVADGGTVSFIPVPHGSPNGAQLSDTKWVQVGKSGVRAVDMMFDPRIAGGLGSAAVDLVYIAGGRDGLWVMKADPLGPDNAHFLLDDSKSGLGIEEQTSARWCNGLGHFESGGVHYLVALFSSADDNRLRVYRLSDVDSQLAGQRRPILALLDVKLGDHPLLAHVPRPKGGFGTSAAWAMAVDSNQNGAAFPRHDVYVALGHHGMARVSIVEFMGVLAAGAPVYGPYFGARSRYFFGQGIPPGRSGAEYGNKVMWENSAQPGDMFYPVYPGRQNRPMRVEYPIVADVAVDRHGPGSGEVRLYAAVDHMGWVSFDVGSQWGPSIPIAHHEGLVLHDPDRGLEARMKAGQAPSYVRQIELAEAGPGQTALVVVADRQSGWTDFYTRTDGPTYAGDLNWGGVNNGLFFAGSNSTYTLGYWVDSLPQDGFSQFNEVVSDELSGPHLDCIGAVGLAGASIFGALINSNHGPGTLDKGRVVFFEMDMGATGGAAFSRIYDRPESFPESRFTFSAARSVLNHDVLLFPANDGFGPTGLLPSGPIEEIASLEELYTHPTVPPPVLGRGLILNPRAQWPSAQPDLQYTWETGVNLSDPVHPVGWMITQSRIVNSTVQPIFPAPTELHHMFVHPGRDRFNNSTRTFLMTGERSEAYDAANPRAPMVFGTLHMPSADGVIAMRRDVLTDHMEQEIAQGGDFSQTRVFDDFAWPLHFEPKRFTTHPESNWMPRGDPAVQSWWGSNLQEANTALYSWRPELVEVDAPEGHVGSGWVLVVPCGHIGLDVGWEKFRQNLSWAPQGVWARYHKHSLVQFFDVSQPWRPGIGHYIGPHSVGGDSPLRKGIGSTEGMAYQTKSKRIQFGSDPNDYGVFCFVADFAGSVRVYDIRGILNRPLSPDAILPEVVVWQAPASSFDLLPNSVQGIEVDVIRHPQLGTDRVLVYVSVRRIGVVVCEFRLGAWGWSLVPIQTMQTSADPFDLQIAVDPVTQRKSLLVAGNHDGVSVYE